MYNLHPFFLMTKTEYKSAKQLLASILRNEIPWEDRVKANENKAIKRKLEKIEALNKEVTLLSELVLGRELGLRRFMVVDVLRHDQYRTQLLVRDFSLEAEYKDSAPHLWCLSGRKLKKDGRLGVVGADAYFNCASITRRHLDGRWTSLEPQNLKVLHEIDS